MSYLSTSLDLIKQLCTLCDTTVSTVSYQNILILNDVVDPTCPLGYILSKMNNFYKK